MAVQFVRITIEGAAATGKSALAQMITTELRRYGMTVRCFDEDAPRHELQLEHVLQSIGPRTDVSIVTVRRPVP